MIKYQPQTQQISEKKPHNQITLHVPIFA